jgi:hypothetical protein
MPYADSPGGRTPTPTPKRSRTLSAIAAVRQRIAAQNQPVRIPPRVKNAKGLGRRIIIGPNNQASTTRTGSYGDINQVRSYNDLQREAQGETDTELQGELTPLRSRLGSTSRAEAADRASLEALHGELQGYASESAQRMRDVSDNTFNEQKQIAAATSTRLNALRQGQAKEAQDLAQQMGGPVAMDKFTGGVDPQIEEQTGLGAAGMSYTADMGSVDVGNAEAFAGRVLPAIQREDLARSHSRYDEERQAIQDQITSLESSKSGKVNAKLNDLLQQERQYSLSKTNQKLDQVKANRDWQATKHTLHNDDTRLRLAQGQFGLQKATTKANIVQGAQRIGLEKIRLTAQQRQYAADQGLSEAKLKEEIRSHMESEKTANARVATAQKANAMHLVDSLIAPTSNKPVTVTKKVYVPPDSPENTRALTGKSGYYFDNKKKQWYHYEKQSMTQAEYAHQSGVTSAVTDPKELYTYLTGAGVPPKMAVGVVRAKTGPRSGSRKCRLA